MLQFTSLCIFLPSSLNEPSFLFPLSNLIIPSYTNQLFIYSQIYSLFHHQLFYQSIDFYLFITITTSIHLSIDPSDNSHSIQYLSLPYRMKQVHVEACHMMHRRWCYRESKRPHCIQHHQPSTQCLHSREDSCNMWLALASLFGPRWMIWKGTWMKQWINQSINQSIHRSIHHNPSINQSKNNSDVVVIITIQYVLDQKVLCFQ